MAKQGLPNLRGLSLLPKLEGPSDELPPELQKAKTAQQVLLGSFENATAEAGCRPKEGKIGNRETDSKSTLRAIVRSRRFPERADLKRRIDNRHPAEFDI